MVREEAQHYQYLINTFLNQIPTYSHSCVNTCFQKCLAAIPEDDMSLDQLKSIVHLIQIGKERHLGLKTDPAVGSRKPKVNRCIIQTPRNQNSRKAAFRMLSPRMASPLVSGDGVGDLNPWNM
jgi:hypothetical protein